MSTRSPHKNFSLSKLERIKSDNYYDEDTKKDYEPTEVDEMIFDRKNKLSEKSQKEYLRGLTSKEDDYYNSLNLKRCSKCKWIISKKYFSPDKSKKSGLRSHCKFCRNIGLHDYLTVLQ
jgi:hypothetical protein